MENEDRFKSMIPEPASVEQLVAEITPGVYESLKTAIELGKWEDGSRLSLEQKEYCMQAVILYETQNIPEEERTGALLSGGCKSKLDS